MTVQTFNILASAVGALAGLAIVPHGAHEAVLAAMTAALLIAQLSMDRHHRVTTLALCGVLGLACTRLTVALVS